MPHPDRAKTQFAAIVMRDMATNGNTPEKLIKRASADSSKRHGRERSPDIAEKLQAKKDEIERLPRLRSVRRYREAENQAAGCCGVKAETYVHCWPT